MTAGAIAVPTIVPLRAPIPGQHKTCIDTNTKVELSSDTPGVTIYYTLNGAKPEPFQTIGPAAKNTFKYREPFRLPGGRRAVKALAVSENGMRESHVVTKTFDVEQVEINFSPRDEDDLEFVNEIPGNVEAQKAVKKFAHKMVDSKTAWNEVQKMKDTEFMMDEMSMMGSGRKKSPAASQFHGSHPRRGHNIDRSPLSTGRGNMGMTNGTVGSYDLNGFLKAQKRTPPDTATQTMRLQRETDFLKCVYCFAPRPSDPYARFCNECGNTIPPLPQTRIPPPEAGQMGTCVHCKSTVPFNAPTCLICEAPLGPQNQPQASVRLAEKLVCTTCGTANPANLSSCVTCESRLALTAKPMMVEFAAPPTPKEEKGRGVMTCSKCGRENNNDARFCDWCGTKPAPLSGSLTCTHCRASNNPYASFCATCGTAMEPPTRNGPGSPTHDARQSDSKWLPLAMTGHKVPQSTVSTQTVGLFYPSQRDITKQQREEEDRIAMEKQMRDRKPLLTAVSPGKGYWRKQIEHICTHLKAQAANNAEFRTLVAEPRMGKIISTAVHEDGYELSLTLNFALRGNKDPFVGSKMGVTQREYLSTYTEGRKSSLSRYGSQESLASGTSTARKTKKAAKKVKKKENNEEKLTTEDKKLLKELGKNGEGSASEVLQLIEEGADPNCVNKDSLSALIIAVHNKHVDAIPVLIQEGADVNKKGPNKGNTALHEAVNLGSSGMEVIDTLLGCGANSQKKNDKGESPYDMAVKNGYESVGRRLTASLGQTALDKLVKPKASQNIDEF